MSEQEKKEIQDIIAVKVQVSKDDWKEEVRFKLGHFLVYKSKSFLFNDRKCICPN